jgi:HSP20 family protein
MAIVKWEPFEEFDRWVMNDMVPSVRSKVGWDMAIDLYEDGNAIIAEMQLPGMEPDKIHVSVREGYLHVSGSREDHKETKDKQFYSKEIRRGTFDRAIRLPTDVDKKNVQADYKAGVLKITMPKSDIHEGTVRVNVQE